jgi:hypothetical protein
MESARAVNSTCCRAPIECGKPNSFCEERACILQKSSFMDRHASLAVGACRTRNSKVVK